MVTFLISIMFQYSAFTVPRLLYRRNAAIDRYSDENVYRTYVCDPTVYTKGEANQRPSYSVSARIAHTSRTTSLHTHT